jgi:hypothetical protein
MSGSKKPAQTETTVGFEALRLPTIRSQFGNLSRLADSIQSEGLRHPITAWTDGTLISGVRRTLAYFGCRPDTRIPVVFVDTIEDAAKRLFADSQDDRCAHQMKWSEVCRLWETLRHLDEPAAAKRLDAARRRGVELRRATLAGKREPGRGSYATDYVLHVLSQPFGISDSTAGRLWALHVLATAPEDDERNLRARKALRDIDDGAISIWGAYQQLGNRRPPTSHPRPATPAVPAAAARQAAAWEKALPQMEGLVAGLVELGPPNPELSSEQVDPVRARLAGIRRNLEKIIKQMKEISQS